MGSIRSIGDRLRQARQTKGVSLEDVSASTRIFKKYLAEIESGTMPAMPATYVRAFIKAYAEQVGLEGEELLRELDAAPPPEPPAAVSASAAPSPMPQAAPPPAPPGSSSPPRQTTVVFAVSAVLILALIGLLLWMNRDRPRQPVQEVAFSDVVKERELQHAGQDSAKDTSAVAVAAARTDSLLLEGVASESVWVHIVIDELEKKEYLFAPMYRLRWKAKKSFAVSVGNGAGITFTLNGTKIGFLGPGRKPVKNVVLAWETLQKLQKSPAPKAGG
jgi:cytoskeletal protein RodZ